jgi:hypothetical protein
MQVILDNYSTTNSEVCLKFHSADMVGKQAGCGNPVSSYLAACGTDDSCALYISELLHHCVNGEW